MRREVKTSYCPFVLPLFSRPFVFPAMVFNPLDRPVTSTLKLPLYYTGLGDTASIRCEEGGPVSYPLDRQYRVEFPVEMGPRSATWFVIE